MTPIHPSFRTHRVLTTVALLGALSLAVTAGARAEEPIRYNRDIRPILSENCFACHGPDSASRKADLRLDRREVAVEMGSIVPGDAESSELLYRITSDEPTEAMPPPKTKKVLTAEQKDLLRRWIEQGAEYEPHWSLIPPSRPEPPAVKRPGWVRNPIDNFILAKLEEHGLAPAPEADRRTLARRLSLDLTGLPPEPAEVEAFVADPAPDAYERYVDLLMASPRWGEHRARYWLDAARYADTHGIHFDNYREMWSYRDWVIAAFNRNMPFDRFAIDQLAGDLVPDATLDQEVASGFNRNHITTNEGGAIDEEYLVLYARDRVETVGQVFLGMTTGCAVCHDHKFDPLSQKEFYELAAFFNNTTQKAMDGNIKDTPPIVFVPDPMDRPRWEALSDELTAARQHVEDRATAARPEFDAWLARMTPEALSAQVPAEGSLLHARLGGREAAATPPGSLEVADAGDFETDQPFSYGAWVKLNKPGQSGAVVARMDDKDHYRGWDLWIEGDRVGAHIVHDWEAKDALKVVSETPVKPGEWNHLFIAYDGSGKAAGVSVYVNGQKQGVKPQADGLKGSIRTKVPLKVAQRNTTGQIDAAIADLRAYGRALPAVEVAQLIGVERAARLLTLPADQRPAAEVDAVFSWWRLTLDPPSAELAARVAALEAEQGAMKARGTIAHVMHEKPEPAMAHILFRGEYDQKRDPVAPDTPEALPAMPSHLPKNRLGFAQWLLLPENPLMARVTVNRFWQELFGQGLVRTAGDFGVAGELPSHPALLDWLAVEFRDSGWDVRHMFKLMVTSASYRQSAEVTPEKREKDGENRLLSRGPRFRMDAEMVRDYALAASGLLVYRVGGPSVRPYQPEGVWEAVAMPESNTRNYKHDTGPNLYRRSVYTFWKRAAPPASMDIFNAPNRETCAVRRERTNTPLQALVTLNDPQFIEAARRLAERVLTEGGETTESRAAFIAQRLLARELRPEEMQVVRGSLDDLAAYYAAHPDDARALIAVGETKADAAIDPATLASWTMLANELMNLDEVLNK